MMPSSPFVISARGHFVSVSVISPFVVLFLIHCLTQFVLLFWGSLNALVCITSLAVESEQYASL